MLSVLLEKERQKDPQKILRKLLLTEIGFMHKRTQKVKNQRAEKKDGVVYLGTQPQHPRDKLKRRTKNTVKKTPEEDEDEVVYLGTQPRHPRGRFRDKAKYKKWHK